MNRSNFGGGSGVIVDVCGPHGAFLDRGELTRIVDFVEKGGWERVKKRDKDRMEEEISALESRKRAVVRDKPAGGGAGSRGGISFEGDLRAGSSLRLTEPCRAHDVAPSRRSSPLFTFQENLLFFFSFPSP